MLKKIGTFLMIMLAICSVLLLLATESRRPKEPEGESVPTTQTTAPGTPSPVETQPGKTAPAETLPPNQLHSLVAQILDRESLVVTKATRLVTVPELAAAEGTAGLAGASHGRALAEEMARREANPVAAFWELVSEGLYEKQKDESNLLPTSAIQTTEQTANTYEYTAVGCRQFITAMLTLASGMDDGVGLELALLGDNLSVEPDQVFQSREEQCRYAYFSCTADRVSYILCVYLRGEEQIRDVELQLLYLRHASGDSEALARMDDDAKKQAAALMAAAELLMTGKTRAGEGQIPFAYEVGGWNASVERFDFTGDPDRGSLTNYRLREK